MSNIACGLSADPWKSTLAHPSGSVQWVSLRVPTHSLLWHWKVKQCVRCVKLLFMHRFQCLTCSDYWWFELCKEPKEPNNPQGSSNAQNDIRRQVCSCLHWGCNEINNWNVHGTMSRTTLRYFCHCDIANLSIQLHPRFIQKLIWRTLRDIKHTESSQTEKYTLQALKPRCKKHLIFNKWA